MRRAIFILIVVSVALLAGIAHAKDLKFAGCSTSTLSYMKAVAAAYEAKTGIKIGVKGGGATLGIKSAVAGTADLGGTCRHLIEGKDPAGAKLTVVAYDALVFIVHKNNPANNITKDQMIKVFEGKIKNWKELGGSDKPIIVVERKSKKAGVRLLLKELLGYDIKLTDSSIKLQSSSEVEKEIVKNPFAFGVTGSGSAVQRELKLLSYEGVAPIKENFVNKKYPDLIRPLYIATTEQPSEDVKKFLVYILSDKGQAVVAKNAISIEEYKMRMK
ncbi:MAG: substrate-binding domain-containing protein [Thermodesulfovibrionia bacterium]